MKNIYFAGGCFWGVEAAFRKLLDMGVLETEVGYTNGPQETVTYKDVVAHSGHAEVVKVTYDPALITLERLVALFFMLHDPTALNQQGNDIGVQYRSAMYVEDEEEVGRIHEMVEQLSLIHQYERPVVTEVAMVNNYTRAEEDHQRYLDKNPTGYCHIDLNEVDKHIDHIVD